MSQKYTQNLNFKKSQYYVIESLTMKNALSIFLYDRKVIKTFFQRFTNSDDTINANVNVEIHLDFIK